MSNNNSTPASSGNKGTGNQGGGRGPGNAGGWPSGKPGQISGKGRSDNGTGGSKR